MSHDQSADHDQPLEKPVAELKEEGQRLVSDIQQGVIDAAERQTSVAADYLKALVAAIDSGASKMGEQGFGRSASIAHGAAGDFGGLVDRLSRQKPGELFENVEACARERPALFFGAAFLAGLAGTRFLKTSAPHGGRAAEPVRPGGQVTSRRAE